MSVALSLMASPVRAELSALVVGGLGGDPSYAERFDRQARTVAEGLRSVAPRPSAVRVLASGATREAIIGAIDSLAAEGGERFVLVLIGHASVDPRQWRFNLSGPDLTTSDLVAALSSLPMSDQLVVLATSASGALLDVLEQPGRLVITATKSGGEINAVRFPSFLADALGSDVADIDRNEILTVAEAFRYADARTREYYDERNLLASEHARLVGEDAASLALARLGSLRLAGSDPTVATLLETRLSLERDYHALLARKGDLAPDDYYAELETLMLSIAALQRVIDRASGWSDEDA